MFLRIVGISNENGKSKSEEDRIAKKRDSTQRIGHQI